MIILVEFGINMHLQSFLCYYGTYLNVQPTFVVGTSSMLLPGLPRAHLVSSSVKPGYKTAASLFWTSSNSPKNDQGRKRFLRNGFCT